MSECVVVAAKHFQRKTVCRTTLVRRSGHGGRKAFRSAPAVRPLQRRANRAVPSERAPDRPSGTAGPSGRPPLEQAAPDRRLTKRRRPTAYVLAVRTHLFACRDQAPNGCASCLTKSLAAVPRGQHRTVPLGAERSRARVRNSSLPHTSSGQMKCGTALDFAGSKIDGLGNSERSEGIRLPFLMQLRSCSRIKHPFPVFL